MRRVSVSKILIQGRSRLKLVLSAIGLLLSMLIIAFVFQVFYDLNHLLNNKTSKDGFNYIQISKEVGLSTTLGLSNAAFSNQEIKKIKSQPFINDVAELWSNDFRVFGEFAGNSFDMFFTSIEDEFVDVDLKDFSWETGQREIPVIVSNQFLAVLNHAVLPSQGRPPIPKLAVKQAVVNLQLSKNGRKMNQLARVVGFSDRINSVLVPKQFLDYANEELSGSKTSKVSMLVLKVKDAASNQFKSYLKRNDYEVSGELPFVDNAQSILKIILSVLLGFGIIILALSIALNLAQFKAVFTENKERIRMLVLLGYSPQSIITSVLKSGLMSFGLAVLLSFVGIGLLVAEFHQAMETLRLGVPALSFITYLIPMVIAGLTILVIRKSLRKLVAS